MLKIVLFLVFLLESISAQQDFNEWKAKHKKKYRSAGEEVHRRGIFSQNLNRINKHNNNGSHSYTLAMNALGDLTAEEINQMLNGFVPPTERMENVLIHEAKFESRAGIPASLDWRNTPGVVSPVKNQGQCGSCWTFSAAGALEGQMAIKKKKPFLSLSEQNFVDCVSASHGCKGGSMVACFDYVYSNGGVNSEATYPYEAKDGSCRYTSANSVATAKQYAGSLPSGNETYLQMGLYMVGPISIGIDASLSSFQFYHSGVYNPTGCSSTNCNHAVLAVGYGTTSDGIDYWIVKNSWGTGWGMNGYINMIRNANNACGIASYAVFPYV